MYMLAVCGGGGRCFFAAVPVRWLYLQPDEGRENSCVFSAVVVLLAVAACPRMASQHIALQIRMNA